MTLTVWMLSAISERFIIWEIIVSPPLRGAMWLAAWFKWRLVSPLRPQRATPFVWFQLYSLRAHVPLQCVCVWFLTSNSSCNFLSVLSFSFLPFTAAAWQLVEEMRHCLLMPKWPGMSCVCWRLLFSVAVLEARSSPPYLQWSDLYTQVDTFCSLITSEFFILICSVLYQILLSGVPSPAFTCVYI